MATNPYAFVATRQSHTAAPRLAAHSMRCARRPIVRGQNDAIFGAKCGNSTQLPARATRDYFIESTGTGKAWSLSGGKKER